MSDWLEVPQSRIDAFADATGDRQWIHVDPVRAASESPFGSTIAHGFLTLSLVTTLLARTLDVTPVRMAVNYGLDRVRFVSPLPSGARLRGRFTPREVTDVPGGGVQVIWAVTLERDGGSKPTLAADWLVRYYR